MTVLSYVFRANGRNAEQTTCVVDGFAEMLIVPAPPETVIFGTLPDQSELPRMLAWLETLGLHVESVRRIEEHPDGPDVTGRSHPVRGMPCPDFTEYAVPAGAGKRADHVRVGR